MKLSKYLKEESKNINKKLLSEEPEKYKQEIAQHFENQKGEMAIRRHTNQYLIIICAVLLVILIVGILIWTFWPQKGKIYYRENESLISIDYADTPTNTMRTRINDSAYTVALAQRAIDMLSGDILYYTFNIQQISGMVSGVIYFVTNANYEFVLENMDDSPITCTWNGFNVIYSFEKIYVNDLPMVAVSGGFVIDEKNKVYFTYNDLDIGQEVTPVNFLDSALIIQ